MKKDLTNQIVWSDIATAYEKALVRNSFYDDLTKKLIAQLKGRKKILDLGCGAGYLIHELMKEDPSRTIVGVDANEYMLEIDRKNVIEGRFGAKKISEINSNYSQFRKPAQAMPVYIDLSAGMPAYFSGNTKEKNIKITQ